METGAGSQAAGGTSIPINDVLAAAKDTELKKLLRAKVTAAGRVVRAQEGVVEADAAIAEYVARTYRTAPEPV